MGPGITRIGLSSALIVSKAGRPKSEMTASSNAFSLSCCSAIGGHRISQPRACKWSPHFLREQTHDEEAELLDLLLPPRQVTSLVGSVGSAHRAVGLQSRSGKKTQAG